MDAVQPQLRGRAARLGEKLPTLDQYSAGHAGRISQHLPVDLDLRRQLGLQVSGERAEHEGKIDPPELRTDHQSAERTGPHIGSKAGLIFRVPGFLSRTDPKIAPALLPVENPQLVVEQAQHG
jgi:hypothetical protein